MEKETAKAVSFCIISPSVTAKGRDTSLAEGGEGSSAPAGAGLRIPTPVCGLARNDRVRTRCGYGKRL